MKVRCYNQNNHKYPSYGGRGIKVCDRWKDSFESFLEDMGPRPSDQHSIDRIDNNADYGPANCRWATKAEQAMNRRTTRWLTHAGKTMMLSEWADHTEVHEETIRRRLDAGWSVERALTEPSSTFKGRRA